MSGMITIGDGLIAHRAEPIGPVGGAVIVIHEIWGLVDHIKNVADRFAAEGYLAVAPDLLSGIGVVPEVGLELQRLTRSADEKERALGQPMMREKLAPSRSPEFARWAIDELKKVVDYLAEQPEVDGNIAVVGFCFGGSYSFALAAADPRIRAAVPFYGQPPESTDASAIACPVLAFYGETDERLIAGLSAVEELLDSAEVDFRTHTYADAGHAFFNDTSPSVYRAGPAADAWKRTLEFLDETLGWPTELSGYSGLS